jgi:hypothetical protein
VTYPLVLIPPEIDRQMEQLGTKYKFWYLDEEDRPWLFKQARSGTGEDWAEKISAELCELLELPHATYELASWQGKRGVVTPSFNVKDGRLVFGNELLEYVISGSDTEAKHRRQHHKVGRVFAYLGGENLSTPYGWDCPEPLTSAASVFVGYLMLDALIGNQDRHDENWGIILLDGSYFLQPTFDHASSLGRNESDATRTDRMTTRDKNRTMLTYVERARSALYSATSAKPLSTLDAFITGCRYDIQAARHWLDKLRGLEDSAVYDVIWRVSPERMSEEAKNFAFQMLRLNKQRILEAIQ